MIWDRLMEFLWVGGCALYVWSAYLVLPALVLIELVLLLLRKRQIVGHLGWRHDESKRS